jgi:hypothetical protein
MRMVMLRGAWNLVIVTTVLMASALGAGCGEKASHAATRSPAVKGSSVLIPDDSPQLSAFASEQVEPGKGSSIPSRAA